MGSRPASGSFSFSGRDVARVIVTLGEERTFLLPCGDDAGECAILGLDWNGLAAGSDGSVGGGEVEAAERVVREVTRVDARADGDAFRMLSPCGVRAICLPAVGLCSGLADCLLWVAVDGLPWDVADGAELPRPLADVARFAIDLTADAVLVTLRFAGDSSLAAAVAVTTGAVAF